MSCQLTAWVVEAVFIFNAGFVGRADDVSLENNFKFSSTAKLIWNFGSTVELRSKLLVEMNLNEK